MANPEDIDRGAVQREAHIVTDEVVREPEVAQALETLRRAFERVTAPIDTQFGPKGEEAHAFRGAVRGRLIGALRNALKKADDKE